MSEVIVERYADTDALVDAAARRFVAAVVSAQRERGSASVVLTGGGTGIGLLKAVRKDPGDIDWSAIDIYWGDDRFVPYEDSERNELQARDALLDHVPVDESRVFPMAPSDGAFDDNPAVAAAAYAQLVPDEFDIHLLGMGGEGHVNSLFPHTDAVRETSATVVAVTDSPKPPPVRVTLTLPAVQRAKEVWLVVSGANKAEAVAAAIGGASSDDIPSAGARGKNATVWLLDEAAASELPQA
ncbi:6-phosphogluconolactonase [Antrihabitans sp. YC2-6]|uniref:6-phosphogluconolactonase n=1 Tax=Antrihabitans sp. YC2-6 TaxID=2799498 RepID=UPI0018F666BE|nr:6-phosphogluconolactonase [Antrihabitans sp. YC2-6]MBJ8345359.1 6-phosphogluconolactonase [Antrihabitans sp. YC2-6]